MVHGRHHAHEHVNEEHMTKAHRSKEPNVIVNRTNPKDVQTHNTKSTKSSGSKKSFLSRITRKDLSEGHATSERQKEDNRDHNFASSVPQVRDMTPREEARLESNACKGVSLKIDPVERYMGIAYDGDISEILQIVDQEKEEKAQRIFWPQSITQLVDIARWFACAKTCSLDEVHDQKININAEKSPIFNLGDDFTFKTLSTTDNTDDFGMKKVKSHETGEESQPHLKRLYTC